MFCYEFDTLLPRRHSLGPPHLPGSGSFAIPRHFPWIMSHPEVWHFLLPHAFPWIPILSAYIPMLLHPRGEFGGFLFYFLAAEVLGGLLDIPLSLFFSIDGIQQGATGRSLRACYRYTNLSVGGTGCVYGSGSVRKVVRLPVGAWLELGRLSVAILFNFASIARIFSLIEEHTSPHNNNTWESFSVCVHVYE